MDLTPRADFEDLFETFTASAWRLECQGVYREPEEAEPLRRFVVGEPDDLEWFADWPEWVRGIRASRRTIGRVRTLTDPITDYLRFELERLSPLAYEAGEAIRVLPAAAFDELGIPRDDFWIFDDAMVGVLHFGERGVSGVEVISDPAKVGEFVGRKRRALAASTPYPQWSAGRL
ncbi:MAG: DUF6879 family protein [Pseudonocardiaceae bacterium]